MRPLDELQTSEPAWPHVLDLVQRSRSARALPQDPAAGQRALWSLQVTDRSPMGSIALHCGGISVDHGWLRVFGGGDPGLATWNHTPGASAAIAGAIEGALVIGADVLGGFFLVDGGRFARPGVVHYLAPETLEIDDLGAGYGEWLEWALRGGTDEFYEHLRWKEWSEEVALLDWAQGLHVYPPLWSVEGRDVGVASRRPVPLVELWGLIWEQQRALGREHS